MISHTVDTLHFTHNFILGLRECASQCADDINDVSWEEKWWNQKNNALIEIIEFQTISSFLKVKTLTKVSDDNVLNSFRH